MNKLLSTLAGVLAISTATIAAPWLQLDIIGGTRSAHDIEITSPDGPFTMYALLNIGNPNANPLTYLNDEWFISAAVIPQTATAADLGTFSINGQVFDVTADMEYGNPPSLDFDDGAFDGGDLQPHDIFPTYYLEYSFSFEAANNTTPYDVAVTPGVGPDLTTTGDLKNGGLMFYSAFTIDVSNLNAQGLHFDLYNKKYLASGDVDVPKNAPFSHDATVLVPEPSLLSLFGLGLLGMAGLRRFRRKR